VLCQNADGTYAVMFTEYGNEQDTRAEDMRSQRGSDARGVKRATAPAQEKTPKAAAAVAPEAAPESAPKAVSKAEPAAETAAPAPAPAPPAPAAASDAAPPVPKPPPRATPAKPPTPAGPPAAPASSYGTTLVSAGDGGRGPVGEKRYPMAVKYHGILLGKQVPALPPAPSPLDPNPEDPERDSRCYEQP